MGELRGLGSPGMRLGGPGWTGGGHGGAGVADTWRAADARVVGGDRAGRGGGAGRVAGTMLAAGGTLLDTWGPG